MLSLASFAFGVASISWALRLKRSARRSDSIAMIDPLTGLFNRRGWDVLVRRETARSAREKTSLTIFYMDIDDFKTINDTHGHTAGDAVLVRIASEIRSAARAQDVVARFGGDEFAVLASDDGSGAFPHGLLARWASAFAAAGVRISVGYAALDPIGSVSAALARADEAMYAMKVAARRSRIENAVENASLGSAISTPFPQM